MKKTILSTLIITSAIAIPLAGINTSPQKADAISKYETYCNSQNLAKLGEIRRTDVIIINGQENPLYCTFSNKDEAIKNLKSLAPNILSYLQAEFKLGPINSENWKEYQTGFISLSATNEILKNEEESGILESFFDIYENYELNKEILEYSKEGKIVSNISTAQEEQLGFLLPYYAPLAIKTSNNIQARRTVSASLPNLNAAIRYAEQWAWSMNTPTYSNQTFSGGDCTNFASQILEASGVVQDVYTSVNSGWWHKRNGSSHTHSVSWIRANAFARYMGVGFGTFVHRTFADSIAVGDFITYDDEYDGEWDHMGFVTAQASAEANHNGNTYRDYKVAQHTLEYNSWTSEDRNGWENVKKPGKTARYGRVRR